MKRPKILQRPRRLPRERGTELSTHPVAFGAVGDDGACLAEATVPRNELHRWMQVARLHDLYALPTVGLHGVTRLTKRQALALTADLQALRDAGEPIAESLIDTVQMVAEHANLTLLVAAGQ